MKREGLFFAAEKSSGKIQFSKIFYGKIICQNGLFVVLFNKIKKLIVLWRSVIGIKVMFRGLK